MQKQQKQPPRTESEKIRMASQLTRNGTKSAWVWIVKGDFGLNLPQFPKLDGAVLVEYPPSALAEMGLIPAADIPVYMASCLKVRHLLQPWNKWAVTTYEDLMTLLKGKRTERARKAVTRHKRYALKYGISFFSGNDTKALESYVDIYVDMLNSQKNIPDVAESVEKARAAFQLSLELLKTKKDSVRTALDRMYRLSSTGGEVDMAMSPFSEAGDFADHKSAEALHTLWTFFGHMGMVLAVDKMGDKRRRRTSRRVHARMLINRGEVDARVEKFIRKVK